MQSTLFALRRPPKLASTIGMICNKRRYRRAVREGVMGFIVSRCVALALLLVGLSLPAQAQDYPSRPITIVVTLAAGTGMDVIARLFAEKLSQSLGKPVVIENKPGASTMLGTAAVASAPPDGYTLLVATSAALSINPTLFK